MFGSIDALVTYSYTLFANFVQIYLVKVIPSDKMFPGFGQFFQPVRRNVDTTAFYDRLGVPKNATESDIKRAYRKLALQHHPDRGGDDEEFKKITRAYEVLADAEKRAIYDERGEEGVADGAPSADQTMNDIISDLLNGRNPNARRAPRKGPDIVHQLAVSLEDLYNGKTFRLAVNRDVPCDACSATGCRNGNVIEVMCGTCGGAGARVQLRQLGMGVVQQMQVRCDACAGAGKVVPDEHRCPTCRGSHVTKNRKVLEVHVAPGAPAGHQIAFYGEADYVPGFTPGDVIFVISEKPHSVFSRQGDDLVMRKSLSLADALCGTEFLVTHLDGRRLLVSTKAKVITPESSHLIDGEGMPKHGSPFSKGRLCIIFAVEFPASGAFDAGALSNILPGRTQIVVEDPRVERVKV